MYAITIDDVQTVAEEVFGRELKENELQIIDDKLGYYFDWYEVIVYSIRKHLKLKEVEENNVREFHHANT